jgi:hypothetical protein
MLATKPELIDKDVWIPVRLFVKREKSSLDRTSDSDLVNSDKYENKRRILINRFLYKLVVTLKNKKNVQNEPGKKV